jgi:penicillin-binding protein 1A
MMEKTPEDSPNVLQKADRVLRKESRWFKRSIVAVWIFTLLLVVGLPLYLWAVIENPYDLFGGMPTLRDIENPEQDVSSEVISSDGVLLGRFVRYHRSTVTFDQLSDPLVNTLLSSEDHRFREHSGVDLIAFVRVAIGLVTFNLQGGGSTLTQQTAKNLFNTREAELTGKLGRAAGLFRIVISKTKEWIIAFRLEQNFTKEEILALYLNTVPFNNNAYGIKVAAETYFQKQPSELNYVESALLVGMLQGTSIFNPINHPERAIRKRNEVLRKVFFHKHISSKQVIDSLQQLPLQLNFKLQTPNEGLAPYFRAQLQEQLIPWCKDRGLDLFESGLKVYVTIDSRLQRYAEDAMKDHMSSLQRAFEKGWGNRNPWVDENGNELRDFVDRKLRQSDTYRNLVKTFGDDKETINKRLQEKRRMKVFSWNGDVDTLFNTFDSIRYYSRFLHAGMMAMEPHTGEVKAWVGGIHHGYFQFDHVQQGKRQPGSTFKPFVYGLAIENGYSPCQLFYDTSPTLNVNGQPYRVRNANGTYGSDQQFTLRQAMARSLNSITIQLMDQLQPQNVAEFAKKLGITSKLDPVYSLALGTSDVSLYELVGSYSTFVNLGAYVKPYYIYRIEDKNGNVLEQFFQIPKQTIDEGTAYKMVHMFKGGVEEEGGTSGSLSEAVKVDNEVGGKTGTTDNGSDGWYVGLTHNLVTGVWVGGDQRSIHFPRWGEGSGTRAALPMWDKFMTRVYSHREVGYPKGTFKKPELQFNFECEQYAPDSLLVPQ